MVPGGFGPVVHLGVVALGQADCGEVALFDVGIEVDGGLMPAGVDVEVVGGVEPVAPAFGGAAEQVDCGVALTLDPSPIGWARGIGWRGGGGVGGEVSAG